MSTETQNKNEALRERTQPIWQRLTEDGGKTSLVTIAKEFKSSPNKIIADLGMYAALGYGTFPHPINMETPVAMSSPLVSRKTDTAALGIPAVKLREAGLGFLLNLHAIPVEKGYVIKEEKALILVAPRAAESLAALRPEDETPRDETQKIETPEEAKSEYVAPEVRTLELREEDRVVAAAPVVEAEPPAPVDMLNQAAPEAPADIVSQVLQTPSVASDLPDW